MRENFQKKSDEYDKVCTKNNKVCARIMRKSNTKSTRQEDEVDAEQRQQIKASVFQFWMQLLFSLTEEVSDLLARTFSPSNQPIDARSSSQYFHFFPHAQQYRSYKRNMKFSKKKMHLLQENMKQNEWIRKQQQTEMKNF